MARLAILGTSCRFTLCVGVAALSAVCGCGESQSRPQAAALAAEQAPSAPDPQAAEAPDGRSDLPESATAAWQATAATADEVLEKRLLDQQFDASRETVESIRQRFGDAPVTKLSGEGDLPLAKDLTERWRVWIHDFLLASYEEHGRHDEAWDALARQFLERVAGEFPFWTQPKGEQNMEPLALGKGALAAGCQDPLVLYCLGAVASATNSAEARGYFDRAHGGFRPTTYPALLRSFAALRLASEIKAYESDTSRVPSLLDEGGRELLYALTDGTYGENNQQLQWRHLSLPATSEGSTRKLRMGLALLDVKEIDPWVKHIYLGDLFRDSAWEARGGGYSYTVNADEMNAFERHMTTARAHLAEAWRLHPEYTEAPQKLIEISHSAGGLARETARFWFDRAVEAQFDNMSAYRSMMFLTRPRWGGSHARMLRFGRECMDTKRYDTDVPWMYYRAINDVRGELGTSDDIFRQAGIYEGLKELFDGAFADPRAAEYKHKFKAQYAVLLVYCGRPQEAQAVLDEEGDQISHEGLISMGLTLQELRDWIENYREPDAKPLAVWPNSLSAAAISQDFKLMAVASQSPDSLSVWNLETNEPLATLDQIYIGPEALAISPDGKQLASGGLDGRVSLWDLATFKPAGTLSGFNGQITTIRYSHDGRMLVASGGDPSDSAEPGQIVIWEVSSEKRLAQLDGHSFFISDCAFSPDDRVLVATATADDDDVEPMSPKCEVFVWNLEERRVEHKLDLFDVYASTVEFSPDGKTLAISGFRNGVWKGATRPLPVVELVDTKSYESRRSISVMRSAMSFAFTSDSRYLLWGAMDGYVQVRDAADGTLKASLCSQPGRYLTGLWLNESARRLFATSSASSRYCGIEFTPQGPTFYSEATLPTFTFPSSIEATALSLDGTKLATVSNFFDIRTWHLKPGIVARVHSPVELPGFDVAFSPDGHHLAAATMDTSTHESQVRVFDTETGLLEKALPKANSHCLRVTFSPDSETLACEGPGHTLEFWDWQDEDKWAVGRADGMSGIGGIGFSHDGTKVATTSYDGNVRLWRVPARPASAGTRPESIALITTSRGPDSTKPGRVEFSRDGKWLVHSNTIETVVADAETLAERFRMPGGFFGISYDSSKLATAGGPLVEIEARVWDLADGHELRAYRGGHKEMILSARFSPDGMRLITAGRDRHVRMWDVASGEANWEMPWIPKAGE